MITKATSYVKKSQDFEGSVESLPSKHQWEIVPTEVPSSPWQTSFTPEIARVATLNQTTSSAKVGSHIWTAPAIAPILASVQEPAPTLGTIMFRNTINGKEVLSYVKVEANERGEDFVTIPSDGANKDNWPLIRDVADTAGMDFNDFVKKYSGSGIVKRNQNGNWYIDMNNKTAIAKLKIPVVHNSEPIYINIDNQYGITLDTINRTLSDRFGRDQTTGLQYVRFVGDPEEKTWRTSAIVTNSRNLLGPVIAITPKDCGLRYWPANTTRS